MLEGDFSKRYWSMMDRRGYIRQIPKGLEEILELQDWNYINSVRTNKNEILILLACYNTISDIWAITLDSKAESVKSRQKFTKENIAKPFQKENIKAIEDKEIYLKFVLSKDGHIFILTSDPKSIRHDIQKHSIKSSFADSDENNTPGELTLDILSLRYNFKKHFQNRDRPVLINDVIYIKGASNRVFAIQQLEDGKFGPIKGMKAGDEVEFPPGEFILEE